jgi:polo-like kinase 1
LSISVNIYTLIKGKPPFENREGKNTYKRKKMNAYSFPENAIISEAAKNLITQILVTDPAKRPTLDQILTHDFFNQGTSIPKFLPTSTLACTPSLSYIRQFMPDAGKDGIVNKPLTTTKLVDRPGGNNNQNAEKDENKNKDSIKNLVVNQPQGDPNLKGPDTWVKKWVDYSSKYGLGYLLSNGFSGVFFNDSSKIILNPVTNQFNYIERRMSDKQEIISTHTMNEFPKELQKKVTLLHHFKNYLEGDSNSSDQQTQSNTNNPSENETKEEKDKGKDKEKDKDKPFTYVKKWMRTRHAILFRLSNKIVQVCFQDKTEIILSSESRVVTYANKRGERTTYPLITALEMSNYEMTKRLKYTKDILTHMLNLNHQRNAQKNQTNNNQDNTKSNNNGKDPASQA